MALGLNFKIVMEIRRFFVLQAFLLSLLAASPGRAENQCVHLFDTVGRILPLPPLEVTAAVVMKDVRRSQPQAPRMNLSDVSATARELLIRMAPNLIDRSFDPTSRKAWYGLAETHKPFRFFDEVLVLVRELSRDEIQKKYGPETSVMTKAMIDQFLEALASEVRQPSLSVQDHVRNEIIAVIQSPNTPKSELVAVVNLVNQFKYTDLKMIEALLDLRLRLIDITGSGLDVRRNFYDFHIGLSIHEVIVDALQFLKGPDQMLLLDLILTKSNGDLSIFSDIIEMNVAVSGRLQNYLRYRYKLLHLTIEKDLKFAFLLSKYFVERKVFLEDVLEFSKRVVSVADEASEAYQQFKAIRDEIEWDLNTR